ncbi:MAG: cupin domain-containing protein [Gemmatimonadetes bacterium]|nr:cupin domain-containing protein [Gemmatimonadota bacterium]
MRFRSVVFAGAAAVLAATNAAAQTPAPGEADPGVRPTRLIDREEIRVYRVDLQGGAVRSVHAHDDVEYHVWVPLEGRLEITVGTAAPSVAVPGQAFFMTRGTRHGFRNLGTTPAAVMEIFVKKSVTATGPDAPGDLSQVLALLAEQRREP